MTTRPDPRDTDPLTLDEAGGNLPSRSDDAVFGLMVFSLTLGIGLLIGIDKGWAFGMGMGFTVALWYIHQWWAEARLR